MPRLNPWLGSENPPHLTTFLKSNRNRSQKALVMRSSLMNTPRQDERERIMCQLTLEKDLFDLPGITREDEQKKRKKNQCPREWKWLLTITETELWLSHAVREAASASGAHILWCRYKADTVHWLPLYRTTRLSEEQLYIVATWATTLEEKKKKKEGCGWADLPITGRTDPKWLTGSSCTSTDICHTSLSPARTRLPLISVTALREPL